MDFSELKSGTDVRGTAMGENANLTSEIAAAICLSFARRLKRNEDIKLKIAIGRDSRLTGEAILDAAANRLADYGVHVLDCGLCSTPSMFMMTKYLGCDGAIMVTASHHPSDKNGLKFFTGEGGLNSTELSEVLGGAGVADLALHYGGKVEKGDFLELYCDDVRRKIKASLNGGLDGFKVVVDAGNGAGGFFAKRILQPLGADISGSQFLEPDGSFPNHVPNPEDKTAMDSISRRVRETNADLGIIFDTDVDRSAIVTSSGLEINRNRLIALITKVLGVKNAYIVTDSVTSDGLTDFIRAEGNEHIRYKRGYRNVIDFAIKLNAEGKNAPLAIETSGHAAFKENYFLDDGAYLAVKLLIEAVKLKAKGLSLESLIEDLKEPVEEAEVRLKLGGDWKSLGAKILTDLEAWAGKNFTLAQSYEGVRANTKWGFFMARMSVHDPIIPINIACNEAGGVSKTAAVLSEFLSPYGLDLTALNKLIK